MKRGLVKNIVQGMSGRLQAQEVWWAPCRLPEEEYLRQPIDAFISVALRETPH